MPTVIAIANQKGGVGKTTTTTTLASGLAKVNLKTLIIDLDTQAQVSTAFGLEKNNALAEWITSDKQNFTTSHDKFTVNIRENLDAVLGGKDSRDIDVYLNKSGFYRETYLKKLISHLPYDVVVLDSAPSFSVLQLNALVAADCLIVPVRMGNLDSDGLAELVKTMTEVVDNGHPISLFGIVPTFFDRTTKETLEQLKSITHTYGSNVWPPIPQDTRVREAQVYTQTLWEYCPNSPAVAGFHDNEKHIGGYVDLLKRVVEFIKNGR